MENINTEFQNSNLNLIDNLSIKIKNIYESTNCDNCNKSLCGSCLNSIRQGLEYLCFYTCHYYNIKITKKNKDGEIIENENPTLSDLTSIIEKYFKENNLSWSKEVGTHIGSIWILGNLGSHAQKDLITNNTEIKKETIINARNSMYIVTKWFYNHFKVECPINPQVTSNNQNNNDDIVNRIESLQTKISEIAANKQNYITPEVDSTTDEFDEIYWDDLVEAIDTESCILFIGQDISIDNNGKSLHEIFSSNIEGRKITYNNIDSFFMPGADKQLKIKAINYYNKEFIESNIQGNNILQKLSKIPFSLIVSTCPDDTIHRIWKQYNKNHQFLFFNGQKQESYEPTKENPIVYNLLGNASKNGNYIFTHQQFYEYINSKKDVKIPTEIETKIRNAVHYLFIGIDFDKWLNRLLLFSLNLDAEGYSLNKKDIEEMNHGFIYEQFNVSAVNSNYESFTDALIQKCKEKNIYEPLIDTFIKNTTEQLEIIKSKPSSEKHIVQLNEIEKKIENILNG